MNTWSVPCSTPAGPWLTGLDVTPAADRYSLAAAWTDDDELTGDPHSEISLIYYPNRQGLEDRVYRLNTGRSAASTPEARTCHTVNNIELIERRGDKVDVRYNWHTLSHRMQETSQFFGTTFCTIDLSAAGPCIDRK